VSDSGSESGGAFRPAGRGGGSSDLGDHPSPNISLGPPLQPPMLPYLYPPNLYSGAPGGGLSPLGPPPSALSLSLFGGGGGGGGGNHPHSAAGAAAAAAAASLPPSLLFNHLLQQQLFHSGYPLGPPVSLASSAMGPAGNHHFLSK
jgi:hypothetical protein